MNGQILAVAMLSLLTAVRYSGPQITNPSFEDDGADIKGVGYVSQGNAVSGWRVNFPGGVGRNTQDGPFVDNGVVPNGRNVCVLQNLASIAQTVRGLEAGRVYSLNLRANARASDAPDFGGLAVELNGTKLLDIASVTPVGKGSPYHRFEVFFTAGTGAAELLIRQTNQKAGVSVLVDDVRIEERNPPAGVNVSQVNPAIPLTAPMVARENDLTDVSWIWTSETRAPAKTAKPGTRFFRRSFELPARAERLMITFTADNECRVYLNGQLAGWSSAFNQLYATDATHLARAGSNVLLVEATNAGDEPNPAGFICKVVAVCGKVHPVVALTSDSAWRWAASREARAGDWRPVQTAGEMGCAPWGWVGPASPRVSRWFPELRAAGNDAVAESVRRMFSLHFGGGRPACTLWDGWLPLAGLWPVRGRDLTNASTVDAWKAALLSREVGPDGYVASHQHRGYGHSKGWPIPLYVQTGGVGFHFSFADDPFRMWVPGPTDPRLWTVAGMEPQEIDPNRGWILTVTDSNVSATTPAFDIPMAAAPCIRLEWQVLSGHVTGAYVQWATADRPDFDEARRMEIAPVAPKDGMQYSDVLAWESPAWTAEGRMTRIRVGFSAEPGTRLVLKSLITPADTRHNINNPCFLQGCAIYLDLTGDLDFLRRNIGRMRKALAFSIRDYRLRESLCVDMRWFGHDGRSGFTYLPDGTRVSRYAVGVANNYWDLLPFGGKDTLATIYHYDALRRMARIERLIRQNPRWRIPDDPNRISPEDLEGLAERIRAHAGKLLWNPAAGRFVACIDSEGVAHDYGYTIVNLEAIHYGFATAEQARSIFDWLDGRRLVEGDTAQGADVYRWRFGPRCSTKRNTEWYSGMWDPQAVPFGDQVQDGGGVLGFSYFDLMARLRTLGPDDAYRRLSAIATWFDEVQAEGGYRAYYAKPGRGTLQGGGPPGGLGLDHEFVESVLVPQVMLYGFLGFQPSMEGFRVEPRLPSRWTSLTISRVRYHGLVMDLTAGRNQVQVTVRGGKASAPVTWLPPSEGSWKVTVMQPGKRAQTLKVPSGGLTVPQQAGSTVRMDRS